MQTERLSDSYTTKMERLVLNQASFWMSHEERHDLYSVQPPECQIFLGHLLTLGLQLTIIFVVD